MVENSHYFFSDALIHYIASIFLLQHKDVAGVIHHVAVTRDDWSDSTVILRQQPFSLSLRSSSSGVVVVKVVLGVLAEPYSTPLLIDQLFKE